MAHIKNPFTPAFGIVPPFLAGRSRLLDEMSQAFEDGVGNPDLSTILIGARGCGKTALLCCIAEEAQNMGWIAVNTVAAPGMLEDILQQAEKAASHLIKSLSGKRLSGIHLGEIVGLEWENEKPKELNWRSRMEILLEQLQGHTCGLLITVDEVSAEIEEMIQLVSTYQLFIRENKNISLVMAGLPMNVTDLVDNKQITFLRRARQRYLGKISDAEIERAFRKTVESSGKTIEDSALEEAVRASDGFAYMMQLVGYCTWAEGAEAAMLSKKHAQRGIRAALSEFEHGVLDSTYREMSQKDRAFARAMLDDPDGSTLTSVAKRMGKKTNYASTYKRRLLKLGIIGDRGGNTFDFDIPYMRDYLAVHKQ